MNILAVIGAPGVGKTTFVRGLIQRFGGISSTQRYGLCDYLEAGPVIVLGKYEEGETFAGTDRLSMAVQPDAEAFLVDLKRDDTKPVVFEGDRLSTSTFFQLCRRVGTLRVVCLQASSSILAQRRQNRSATVGKGQDAEWLAGRESKVHRLSSGFNAELCNVDTPEEMDAGTLQMFQWLSGLPETVAIKKPSLLF